MKFRRKISPAFIWTLVFTIVFSNFAGVLNLNLVEASTVPNEQQVPTFKLGTPSTVVNTVEPNTSGIKYDFKNIKAGKNGLVGYYYDKAKELTFPDWEKSVVMGYYNPITKENVVFNTYNYTYSSADPNKIDFTFNGSHALYDNTNQASTILYNVVNDTKTIIPTYNNAKLDSTGKLILTEKYALFNDTGKYGAFYNLETGELKYKPNVVSSVPYAMQPSGHLFSQIYLNNNAIEFYDVSQTPIKFVSSIPLVRDKGGATMNITDFHFVDDNTLLYAENNSGVVTWHVYDINTKVHTKANWKANSVKEIYKTYVLGDDNTLYSVKDNMAFKLEYTGLVQTNDVTMNDVGIFATKQTSIGETELVQYGTNPELIFNANSLLDLLRELVKDLSTQDKILNAQSVLESAQTLSVKLPSEQAAVVNEELSGHQYTILEAQVDLIESLAVDLSTQSDINEVNSAINYFNALIVKLEDGQPKTDLINRVNQVQINLNQAQDNLYNTASQLVDKALLTKDASDVENAYKAVISLPEGTQKQELLAKLNTITVVEIKNIEAGNNVSLVLFPEKNIQAIGNSSKGQLEILNATNAQPLNFSLEDVKKVDTSQYATFVLLNNGDVYGSGSSYPEGILGNTNTSNPTFIKLPVSNVKDIAAGADHILFQLEDGSVKGMGSSARGQLGKTTSSNPTPIDLPVSNVKNIYAGHQTSYFVLQDGKTVGLGASSYGNLGNSNYTNSTPVLIPINNVKKIAAGKDFTLFLLRDNTAVGLGTNSYGQLLGKDSRYTSPYTIPVSNIKDVDAGYTHALFLIEDGTVVGSGKSANGELVLNLTRTDSPTTIPVENVSQISAGYYHSLFLINDGSIKGSGKSSYGELGNNKSTNFELVVLPMNLHGNLIAEIEQKIVVLEKMIPTIDTNEEVVTARALVVDTETLMKKLPAGEIKTSLQARLDTVINGIDQAEFAIEVKKSTAEMVILEQIINDDLSTQLLIDKAETQFTLTSGLVNALKDSAEKTSLLDRLNKARINIDAAKVGLQIAELEKQLGDLSTLDLVNSADTKYQELLDMVNALPDSPAKTELLNRLKLAKERIDIARENLGITKATKEVNDLKQIVADLPMEEEAIANAEQELKEAIAIVDTLPEGPEKDQLLEDIRLAQEKIEKTKLQMEIERINKLLTDLEVLVRDGLPTQISIDNAKSEWNNIQNAVSLLPEIQERVDFQNRLNILDGKIKQAQKDYDVSIVEKEVVKAETMVSGELYSQELITLAQTQIDYARNVVNAIQYEDAKLTLNQRLDEAQEKLNYAIEHIDVAIATKAVKDLELYMVDGLANQSMIDTATGMFNDALSLVRALEDSAEKESLLIRLANIKHQIDFANSTTGVSQVEKLANGDLSNYELIANAQSKLDEVLANVSKLPEGEEKDYLLYRLAIAQDKINVAKDQLDIDALLLEVVKVENLANGDLSTQDLIDHAQSEHDRVFALVDALKDGITKTEFLNRLQVSQDLINQAQYNLDLANATKAVVKAEEMVNGDLSTQELIDAAQTQIDKAYELVNALPNGEDKTSLLNRLENLKMLIVNAQKKIDNQKLLDDANQLVKELEDLLNGDLSNQDLINEAQDKLDQVLEQVKALPEDIDNSGLLERIENSQDTIDTAQENLNNQQLVDEANKKLEELQQLIDSGLTSDDLIKKAEELLKEIQDIISQLPDSEEKDALLEDVQQQSDAIEQGKVELETQKAIDNANEIISDLEELLDGGLTSDNIQDAEQAIEDLKEIVATLPEGNAKTELEQIINELEKQVEDGQYSDKVNEAIADVIADIEVGLDNQDDIDNAQEKLDKVLDIINQMPAGPEKDKYLEIVAELQEQIDLAQMYLDIHAILNKVLSRDLSTFPLIEKGILEFKEDILLFNGVSNPTEEQIIAQQVSELQKIIQSLPEGNEKYILLVKYDKAFDRLAIEAIDLLQNKQKPTYKPYYNFPIINGVLDYIQNNSKNDKVVGAVKVMDYKFNTYFVPAFNSYFGARYKHKDSNNFEQFSPIILDHLVQYAIKETDAKSFKKDKGKVISYLSPIVKDKATGKQIQDIAEKYLN